MQRESSAIFFVKSYAVGYIHVQCIRLGTNPSIVSRGLKADISATIQGHKRALTTANPMKSTGQMPKLLMPPPSSISIATWRAGTSVDNSSLWTGREVHYHQSMTSWTCTLYNHQPAESPQSLLYLFMLPDPSTSRQTSSSRRDNWNTSDTPLMLTPSTNSRDSCVPADCEDQD